MTHFNLFNGYICTLTYLDMSIGYMGTCDSTQIHHLRYRPPSSYKRKRRSAGGTPYDPWRGLSPCYIFS